jgi:hypothetical protein
METVRTADSSTNFYPAAPCHIREHSILPSDRCDQLRLNTVISSSGLFLLNGVGIVGCVASGGRMTDES